MSVFIVVIVIRVVFVDLNINGRTRDFVLLDVRTLCHICRVILLNDVIRDVVVLVLAKTYAIFIGLALTDPRYRFLRHCIMLPFVLE